MRQTMTMRLCLVTLLALLTALWAGAAGAATIPIDETNFPDPVFRAYVAAELAGDPNATEIDTTHVDIITIDSTTSTTYKISDMTGIKLFTDLVSLTISSQTYLTTLDLSGLVSLYNLEVHDCPKLTQLDISNCSVLFLVYVQGNPSLRDVDLSRSTEISTLQLENNRLSFVDLSDIDVLTNQQLTLGLSGNPLTDFKAPGDMNCTISLAYENGHYVFDLSGVFPSTVDTNEIEVNAYDSTGSGTSLYDDPSGSYKYVITGDPANDWPDYIEVNFRDYPNYPNTELDVYMTWDLPIAQAEPVITAPGATSDPADPTKLALPHATEGRPYSYTFSAVCAGDITVNDWSADPVSPAGLTFTPTANKTATLSGTPSAAADYDFTITATSGQKSETQNVTLTVDPLYDITGVVTPAGTPAPGTVSFSATDSENNRYDHASVTTNGAAEGDIVTVTASATPNSGYQPGGLTVTDASNNAVTVTNSGNGTYTFTMPASAVTVTANFTPKPLASVSGIPSELSIMKGGTATLTLTLEPTDVLLAVTDPVTFSWGQNLGITPSYDETTKTITLTAGNTTGTDTLTITVRPEAGAVVVATCQVTVTADECPVNGGTYPNATVTPSKNTVKFADAPGATDDQKKVTVTITPNPGYAFTSPPTGVSIDPSGAATAGNIVDNGDGTYSCELSNFQADVNGTAVTDVTIGFTGGTLKAIGYAVTVTPTTNGTVTASVNGVTPGASITANVGDTITLTVAPESTGYRLKHGTMPTVKDANGADVPVSAGATLGTYTFTMPASNVTVSATFEPKATSVKIEPASLALKQSNSAVLTVILEGTAGHGDTIERVDWTSPSIGVVSVSSSVVSLTGLDATAKVTASSTSGSATITATVTTNKGETFTAECEVTVTDQNTANVDTSGLVNATATLSPTNFRDGDNVTLTVTAKDGYVFTDDPTVKLTSGAASVFNPKTTQDPSGKGVKTYTYTFNNVMGDLAVTVTGAATEILYDVTVTQPTEGGTIAAAVGGTPSTSSIRAQANDTVMLTAKPDPGWELDAWSVKQGNVDVQVSNGTFTMPAQDVSVSATFKKKVLQSVSIDGTADVTVGQTKTLSIVTDPLDVLLATSVTIEYSTDNGFTWDPQPLRECYVICDTTNKTITITGNAEGKGRIKVTVQDEAGSPSQSAEFDVTVTPQQQPGPNPGPDPDPDPNPNPGPGPDPNTDPTREGPTGLEPRSPSSPGGKDGWIGKVTDQMEWSLDGVDWLPCEGEAILGLGAGRYWVRWRGTGGAAPSLSVIVEIVDPKIPGGRTYKITVTPTKEGEIIPSAQEAEPGVMVWIHVSPEAGRKAAEILWALTGQDPLRMEGAASLWFLMPESDVTVTVTFDDDPDWDPDGEGKGGGSGGCSAGIGGLAALGLAAMALARRRGRAILAVMAIVGTLTLAGAARADETIASPDMAAKAAATGWTFTATAGPNGTVAPASLRDVPAGTSVDVVITPAPGHVVDAATWTTSTGLKAVSRRTTRLTFPMPSADVSVDVTFRDASQEEREGKGGGGSKGCSLGLGGAATIASVALAIVRRRRDRSIGA